MDHHIENLLLGFGGDNKVIDELLGGVPKNRIFDDLTLPNENFLIES
jgi:hypothetical protein